MAIYTSILTGGDNNHETTSEEANGVATDFIAEGIVGSLANTSGFAPATGGFAVNAQGTPAMAVDVSSGVSYVTGTPSTQNSQTFRIKNTATSAVTISANSSGSTKYDWIYIKLDATNLDDPNTAGDNVATLVASRSSSAASDDGTPPTYCYPIAVVTVANAASTITNSNIRDIRAQTYPASATSTSDGWTSLASQTTFTVSTGYNKGQKEYDLTSSADLTGVLSPGMRLKLTRATTPPTQCADFEQSSSQYASKTSPSGLSFTDDFTCEAWIKLESYGAASGIVARRNADTEGWSFQVESDGRLSMTSLRIASNNRQIISYQSVPLGEWVHVAATMDNSANSHTMYINGVSVPFSTTTTGTITALVQGTTALVVGANKSAGTNPFDGKISEARVWSAVRTATEIRDNMNQQLVGNETNLVAYFQLDGDFTDSTSNANDLTGQNGAVATSSDNPMNSTEYAIITKVTASTITVFTGTDYNIPNLTLSNPYYSTQKAPFGFPASSGKWSVTYLNYQLNSKTSPSADTFYNSSLDSGGGLQSLIPLGAWDLGFRCHAGGQKTATAIEAGATLSTANNTAGERDLSSTAYQEGSSAAQNQVRFISAEKNVVLTAATTYYLNIFTSLSSMTNIRAYGSYPTSCPSAIKIYAKCAYI